MTHKNETWTDEAVARLPLGGARAELLEEIMATPVVERPVERLARRRAWTWAAPVAAAAAVAALATASLWWPGDDEPGDSGVAVAQSAPPASSEGYYPTIAGPGWQVEDASEESYDGEIEGEIEYAGAGVELEMTWRTGGYADQVAEHDTDSSLSGAGAPVLIDGLDALMWSYEEGDDHRAVVSVDDGHWVEVRAQAVDATEFLAVLEQVRLVDRAGFEAVLPASFVTDAERPQAIADIRAGIEGVTGAGLPAGAADPTSIEMETYGLGADIAGGYACAWTQAYVDGDTAMRTEAQRVLGTAREWPVLREMRAEGDYSSALWEITDQVAQGTVPNGWREGIC